MRLPSNTTLDDFIRHHQPDSDSPMSWLVEKCKALQDERARLITALEECVWACQERDKIIDLAADALDRAAITEARDLIGFIDTTEKDLPNTDVWGID